MCNLYSMTRNQEAIRRLFRVGRDFTGNLPPLPAIFPDMMAPTVRCASDDGERGLVMMRWGMPCPPQIAGPPVTNIRNTKSQHWRRWLGPANRCLVPATSFCEWSDTRPKTTH
jgi:putative SOS response-associated peptidase YedK